MTKRKGTDGMATGKKSPAGCLHEKAEASLAWARAECDRRNAAGEKAAIAAFEAGEVAQLFRDEGKFAIGRLVYRMREVQCGEHAYPMSARDSNILVRLLSARTTVDYDGWWFNPLLDDAEIVRSRRNRTLLRDHGTILAFTEASDVQALLRKALLDYAYAAATFAKHKKSASVMQWIELVDALDRIGPHSSYVMPEDDARHLVALERAASDCLRFEAIMARLPRFKAAKRAVR